MEGLDKILAIPTSQKVALLVVSMGLVGALWYFLYFEETMNAIAAENRRTPQLQQDRTELKKKKEQLKDAEARIADLEAKRADMQEQLPEDADIAELLNRIHQKAQATGLEIARFERGDMVPEELYARIPVRMVLKGTYVQIAQFLHEIGEMRRLVNVEDIKLSVDGKREGGSSPELTASCTATTFMYLSPEKARELMAKQKK